MPVSFVIPLYNCLPLTQATVASLQATVPKDLGHEIVLVDDGSTDGTREWLAALGAPFRVVLNERNLGYGAANNRGVAASRYDFLVLLNNDLVLTPGWLEPMLDAFPRFRGKTGVVGNVQIDAQTGALDHAGIFINYKGKPEHDRTPAWKLRIGNGFKVHRRVTAVTGACVAIRRDLWRELRGFDEGYMNGCEDVDFCLRAEAAGYVNVVALTSVIRHHVSTSPGRKRLDEANTYRLTLRWRDALPSLGADSWCRDRFESLLEEPRDCPTLAFAGQLVLYLLGLRRKPPREAADGMRAATDLEIGRWEKIFENRKIGKSGNRETYVA